MALTGTVDALVTLVDARDCYTSQRTQGSGALTLQLALALGVAAEEARMTLEDRRDIGGGEASGGGRACGHGHNLLRGNVQQVGDLTASP